MRPARAVAGLSVLAVVVALAAWVLPDPSRMLVGAPDVKSLGVMTFGPGNTLFIGDSEAGSILAIEVQESAGAGGAIELEGIDQKIAQVLGTTPQDIVIGDLAVHPVSKNVYVTVTRGRGAEARPVLLRVTRNAANPIEEVSLDKVRYSVAPIPNAPAANPAARRNPRTYTVTDLAFADGQLYVAGLSNEEFSSAFRRMSYPFGKTMETTTLEIYHVSHGRNETNAPVMTFLPQRISGKQYILAAYTCTPLVAFEVETLKNGQHVFGRTVAELGAGNQPLDMVSFERDGKNVIVIANSRHPLMLVDAATVAGAPALKSPSKDEGIARTPLAQPGIRQLADLDANHVVVIQTGKDGGLDLRSIAKASL
ncbi:MAG: hypothetical protein ACREMA_13980 [Longimicrobiales bacterium]